VTRYRKTIAAVVTGVIGWASAVVASDPATVTATEWIMLATVVATALGVFGFPNTQPASDNHPALATARTEVPVTAYKKAAAKKNPAKKGTT
jgi:hypothetical protein